MHMNPDVVALLALGEQAGTPDDLAHLSGCRTCQAELDEMRATVEVGRRTTDQDVLLAPPPQVWQRIRDELHLSTTTVTDRAVMMPARGTAEPVLAAAATGRSSRSLRAASLALAAVLALAVGIGLGANLNRLLPDQTPVSSVQLNALPQFAGSSGRASVVQDRDGNRTLVVQISSPAPATGRREVWMTTTVADPMLPMGYLVGDSGRFPIPPGVDLQQFRLIDISQEPENDTNPGHSGRSMLRGKLSA